MKRVIRRKGFAIILVAALAGLVFLLGASLVAVSQLQSASANYDQRVRLAREHARAALDMAVAELQERLGKDTSVSYLADYMRAETTDNFREPETTELILKQPFWTGTRIGTKDYWLVTRPLSSTESLPDPSNATTDYVELIGDGTVGLDTLKVSVPKEAISVTGVDGFLSSDAKPIGNYAYWVGDLGVKASYAWYDQLDAVSHDEYGTTEYDPDSETEGDEWFDRQARLRQMTVAKPNFLEIDDEEVSEVIVNTNESSPSNPDRIEQFVSDFQFRDRYGSSSELEYFLHGLTESEVKEYFQDFTPLSKGLLVDSKRGGLKLDLTSEESPSGGSYRQAYKAYSEFYKTASVNLLQYDFSVFFQRPSGLEVLPVLPVITQFNINYSVSFSSVEIGTSVVSVSLEASLELWNPYTSALEFGEGDLSLVVEGLPTEISVWLNEGLPSGNPDFVLDAEDLPSTMTFDINEVSGGSKRMRAGEIVLLSGPIPNDVGGVDSTLSSSSDSTTRVVVCTSVENLVDPLDHFYAKFGEVASSDEVNLNVQLKNDSNVLLNYSSGTFTLSKRKFDEPLNVTPPRFGFSWEFKDIAFPFGDTTMLFKPILESSMLDNWNSDSSATGNTEPVFLSAEDLLFGETKNSNEGGLTKLDFSVLKLPKQQLTNVGQLSIATGIRRDALIPVIGDGNSANNQNSFFDQYFFSTIPQEPTDWSFGDALPNSNYIPRPDINSFSDIPAEDLYVHGMFNVHSTSINAWAAILKGAPVSKHPYWKDIWKDVFDVDTYLFMNHPLGGEDINILDTSEEVSDIPEIPSGTDYDDFPLEAKRASLKKNAFALTEDQVNALAALIVKEIRTYVQGSGGSFDSLEEFVNSGVLQNAIDALNGDATLKVNPSWVIPGTPAEFRQSTILNLISGILSVRSDTFLVRAYGDAVNPANGKIWARAYCEAILQRTHEQYGNVIDAGENKSAEIDRKFEVVAFRWLAPSEI